MLSLFNSILKKSSQRKPAKSKRLFASGLRFFYTSRSKRSNSSFPTAIPQNLNTTSIASLVFDQKLLFENSFSSSISSLVSSASASSLVLSNQSEPLHVFGCRDIKITQSCHSLLTNYKKKSYQVHPSSSRTLTTNHHRHRELLKKSTCSSTINVNTSRRIQSLRSLSTYPTSVSYLHPQSLFQLQSKHQFKKNSNFQEKSSIQKNFDYKSKHTSVMTALQHSSDEVNNIETPLLGEKSSQLLSQSQAGGSCGLPKLSFQCQLAHGSPVHYLSGFNTMHELYEKIATSFSIPISQILYCTLNTHKVDMDKLLGGQIGLNDVIFVHCKGQTKEVEVIKSNEMLGLTITDNGNGICFIKKIKENSVIDKINFIKVGDHIEMIDNQNFLGVRHFEVAKALKQIELGKVFIMRLIEPCKDGFGIIAPRGSRNLQEYKLHSGKETLRFRAKGSPVIESLPNAQFKKILLKINFILEQFMGIADDDLALQIVHIGQKYENPHEFLVAIQTCELNIFEFSQDMIFDLWGAIHDTFKQKA